MDKIAEASPDLVILDLRLGAGMSGVEVLRRTRTIAPKVQVIVVTAVEDRNVADMARGLGAAAYLTKPIRMDDLERIVLSRLEH